MNREGIEQLIGYLALKVYETNTIGEEVLFNAKDNHPLVTFEVFVDTIDLTVFLGGYNEKNYPKTEHIKTESYEPITDEILHKMIRKVDEVAAERKKKVAEYIARDTEKAKEEYERLSQPGC